MKTASLAATAFMLACACRGMTRPDGVPPSAVRLGTAAKYYFVNCEPNAEPRGYDCTVFGASGRRMARGTFELIGASAFDVRDPSEYLGFDGSQLNLTADRKLIVKPPRRPSSVPGSALWGGGPSCGAFLDCKTSQSSLHCELFDEVTGESLADGQYIRQGNADAGLASPRTCNVRNGDRIYLEDESFLEPTR